MDAVKPFFEFKPNAIRIAVAVEIVGPTRSGDFTFSLDTAATRSSIRPSCLRRIGFDLSKPVGGVNVRGVLGVGTAKTYSVESISALGHTALNLLMIAQDYPPSVKIDGLLGLDFFRGRILTIDFHQGRITLRPPHPRWQFWR